MRLRIYIVVLASMLLSAVAANAQSAAFTYQGRLTDSTLPAGGTYQMEFRLFDAVTAGTQIGSTITNNSVTAANGVFTVNLDFGTSPFSAGADRWLGISVRKAADPPGFTLLTPRQQITSSPYSLRTLSATAADSLSATCNGCVDSARIANGTIVDADISGTAAIAGSKISGNIAGNAANVTGTVALANGGTGSTTKNFVDLTTTQTAAGNKTFTNDLRNNGLFRSGNETGTSESPIITNESNVYNGLVIRRINSSSTTLGSTIARTETITFERDGTFGGVRISYVADFERSLHCVGVNSFGNVVAKRIVIPQTAGTAQVFTNAEAVEFLQCSFGTPINFGNMTQITIQRYPFDTTWNGTVISTYNQ